MLNFRKVTALLVLSNIFIFSGNSYAADCFSQSPNLIDQGDSYFDLRASGKLSREEQKTLNKLFSSLTGDWAGSSTVTTCLGSIKSPREELSSIGKQTEISSLKVGELDIRSVDSDIIKKKNNSSAVKLSYGSPGIFISKIGESDFKAVKKFRITASSSRILEEIYSIKLDNDNAKLHISIKRYTNGYLSSAEEWSLNK